MSDLFGHRPSRRRWHRKPWFTFTSFAVVCLAILAGLPSGVAGQSVPLEWHHMMAPSPEDLRAREPDVMRQQFDLLLAQTHLLGAVTGLPRDTGAQLASLRGVLDSLAPEHLAALAFEAGPHISQLNRVLANINQSSFTIRVTSRSSGFPDAIYPDTPTPGVDLSGDPPDVSACDPEADDYTECVADIFGFGPPDPVGSGLCSVDNRKDASTLFGLKIGVVIAETAAAILNRICNQDILGFNAQPVCIVTDLIYLALRTADDFVLLCEDLLTASEILGSYERLAHIHGDIEGVQTTIDGVSTDLATHDSNLSTHDAKLASHDSHLTQHDMNLDTHDANLTTHDDDIKSLLASAQGAVDKNEAILLQALKLLITPQGKREIEALLLTCEGDSCPVVLPCASGSLEYPCK